MDRTLVTWILRQLVVWSVTVIGIIYSMRSPTIPHFMAAIVGTMLGSWYIRKVVGPKPRLKCRGKAVLITGCDTGFGNKLALELDRLGALVFAGCLDSEGENAQKLVKSGSQRLRVLQMDVTSDEQVQQCKDIIQKSCIKIGLWGIVNNAAINQPGDIDLVTLTQFRRTMEVNLFGVIRVTKAFLPMIRQRKGRIVQVTSVKGRQPLPLDAAYGLTKFAGESFTDSLRMEMKRFGVSVSIVEPGNFGGATGIMNMEHFQRSYDEIWQEMDNEKREVYGKEYLDEQYEGAFTYLPTSCYNLAPVVDAMIDALFSVSPKGRYLVSGSSRWPYDDNVFRARLYAFLPDWAYDWLVHWQVGFGPQPQSLKNG